MRPDLQEEFIERVTDASYAKFIKEMNEWVGYEIEYRMCEMPIFVSADFRRQLETSAREIIELCCTAEVYNKTYGTLEPRYTVQNESKHPLFSVVDFAVTLQDGKFKPKLIELQGFPSLFGYQFAFADHMRKQYQLDDVSGVFSEIPDASYFDLLRRVMFADQDPANCALIEIDPDTQKTKSDFVAMQKYIGLQTINIRDLFVEDGKLMARHEGQVNHLKRVFNRAIIDELDDLGVELNFSWSQDVDVEWVGHPNWYFRISKFVIPFLNHPSVPNTEFLTELQDIPHDLERWVLKPLYSFAGKGVNVNPTPADVEHAQNTQPDNWILQEKVTYAECIATPHGNNKVEIRVMLIWEEGTPHPIPVMSLARTGRGEMMGARYNVLPWTGSSGCLFTE